MRAIALVLVLAGVALGAAACGGGYGGSGGSSSSSNSSSGSGKTELEMDNYYFKPKTVSGAAGTKVTLELKNDGSVSHNFSLDAQGVSKDVAPGETAEVTVTVPKSGMLTFYCRFHRSMGMTGTLQAGSSSSSSSTSTSPY